MHHVPEIISVIVLAAWLLVSIVAQIPSALVRRMRQWDTFGAIPNWSFFAPRPISHDYHLLYRDRLSDGSMTDWTELRLVTARRWWCFVWNPDRRQKKAMFDATSMLARLVAGKETNGIQISVPYLLLLNFVSELPRSVASTATQFLLMTSQGPLANDEPTEMFLSALHELASVEA